MYLGIDASTKSIALAIEQNGKILSSLCLESGKTHSVDLMPSIDFMLKSQGIKIKDISKIVLANGPGSFTGLRIAISTAKGLAHPFNTPLETVSTLSALSQYGEHFDGVICPVMDARRNRVYTTAFDGYLGNRLIEEKTEDIAVLIDELKTVTDKKILFVGDGLRVYADVLRDALKDRCVIGESHTELSNAIGLLQIARQGLAEKCDFFDVPVNYVRKPKAEREREANAST